MDARFKSKKFSNLLGDVKEYLNKLRNIPGS